MEREYLSFVLLILMLACTQDDVPVVNDFEIETDAQYYAKDQIDAWVFFNDSEGKLIDQAQITNGGLLNLRSFAVPNQKISVTLVKVLKNLDGRPSFYIESFLNVNFPTKWKLNAPETQLACENEKGVLDLTIEDLSLGNLHDVSASDLRATYYPLLANSSASSFKFSPLNIAENCSSSFFLYALDKSGSPKYKFIEFAQPGAVTYSLKDFTSFDKITEITLPPNAFAYLYVKAFDAGKSVHGEGYTTNAAFSSFFNNIPISSYKIGYLDRFPKYRTSVYASYNNFQTERYAIIYDEAGSTPSTINLDNDFNPSVTNSSFSQYNYASNKLVVFKRIRFGYSPLVSSNNSYIEWAIFSGDDTSKNPIEIPNSFTQKYPDFYKDKLTLYSSLLYTKYNSFDEEIAFKFEGVAKKEAFIHFGKELY